MQINRIKLKDLIIIPKLFAEFALDVIFNQLHRVTSFVI